MLLGPKELPSSTFTSCSTFTWYDDVDDFKCQNREAVRDYYAKFYLADRTGTVIAGMGVITLHFFKDPWIVSRFWIQIFKKKSSSAVSTGVQGRGDNIE